MTSRRFPAPWSAEVQPNYYVVRDADGQQLRTFIIRMIQIGDQRRSY